MATIQAIAGFGQGTHQGLVTGNTANRVFNSASGTLGTDIQIIAGAAFGAAPYGLRISGADHWVRWDTNTLGSSKTAIVVAGWFRVSTDPGGLKETHVFDLNNAGSDWASFDYNPSTNRMQAYINATNQSSSMTIQPNDEIFLEFCYDISTGTHSLQWRINGIGQTTVTLAQAADTFTGFLLGDASSGTSGAFDYGHIVLSTTAADYPLGPHKVERLTVDPAGTVTLSGTSTNFQTFSGSTPTKTAWNATTARDNLAEVPPSMQGSQDGWVQITTAASDFVEMPMTTYTLAPGETVAAGRMLACGYSDSATAAFLGLRSWNGTTERTLFGASVAINGNNTTSPWWVAAMLTVADINTQTELDALAIRGGFSSDAAPDIGVHAVYVEVAIFTGNAVVTPATITATATVPRPAANITAAPAAVATAAAVPQAVPVTSTPAVATPATITTAVALPRPAVGPTVTPAPVVAAAALARPAVHVAAAPAVLAAAVAVLQANPIVAGNATATPLTIATVAAIPRPAVNTVAAPALLALLVALHRPAVGPTLTPATVAAVAALARPTPHITANPAILHAAVAILQPGAAINVNPALFIALVDLPQATALVTSPILVGIDGYATAGTFDGTSTTGAFDGNTTATGSIG